MPSLLERTTQIRTRTGIRLNIRPASPNDLPDVREFLQSVSPKDLRFRFLSAVKPSDALVRILTEVDHETAEDLIAFDVQDNSIAASGMIAQGQSPGTAEIAVLVRSDLKGHGVGWEMLKQACQYAKTRGFNRAECIESSSNTGAILLEREQGFEPRMHPQHAELTILSRNLD